MAPFGHLKVIVSVADVRGRSWIKTIRHQSTVSVLRVHARWWIFYENPAQLYSQKKKPFLLPVKDQNSSHANPELAT